VGPLKGSQIYTGTHCHAGQEELPGMGGEPEVRATLRVAAQFALYLFEEVRRTAVHNRVGQRLIGFISRNVFFAFTKPFPRKTLERVLLPGMALLEGHRREYGGSHSTRVFFCVIYGGAKALEHPQRSLFAFDLLSVYHRGFCRRFLCLTRLR